MKTTKCNTKIIMPEPKIHDLSKFFENNIQIYCIYDSNRKPCYALCSFL